MDVAFAIAIVAAVLLLLLGCAVLVVIGTIHG